MSLISPAQAQDGVTGVNAAAINNPINTIANDYNGNITDANVASGAAIAANKIAGGIAGMFGASTSFTPSWTNLTTTSGTNVGHYIQIGKWVNVVTKFTLGASSAVGTNPTLTLPVTAASTNSGALGVAVMNNATSNFYGAVLYSSTTTVTIDSWNATVTYLRGDTTSASIPFTWGSTHTLSLNFWYEAA